MMHQEIDIKRHIFPPCALPRVNSNLYHIWQHKINPFESSRSVTFMPCQHPAKSHGGAIMLLLSQLQWKRVASCLQLITKKKKTKHSSASVAASITGASPAVVSSLHPASLGVIHQDSAASISARPRGQDSLWSTALRVKSGAPVRFLTASSTPHPRSHTHAHTRPKHTHTHRQTHKTSGGPN